MHRILNTEYIRVFCKWAKYEYRIVLPVPGHHLVPARHADALLGLNVLGDKVLDLPVLVLHLLEGGGHVVQVSHQVIRGLVHVHVARDGVLLDLSVLYLWYSTFVHDFHKPDNLRTKI